MMYFTLVRTLPLVSRQNFFDWMRWRYRETSYLVCEKPPVHVRQGKRLYYNTSFSSHRDSLAAHFGVLHLGSGNAGGLSSGRHVAYDVMQTVGRPGHFPFFPKQITLQVCTASAFNNIL